MSKFKVGDKVVCTCSQVYGEHPYVLPKGYVGKVTSVTGDAITVDGKAGEEGDDVMYERCFDLVDDSEITYDEFHSRLKTLLQEALEAGIGVKSIHLQTMRNLESRYIMLSMDIDAEVSGYHSENK